ncbi:MAG TPA: hypothetical protein PKM31_01935 [Bacillota bacterium]|nr:hypothetical protein [Bacillota bacterium]
MKKTITLVGLVLLCTAAMAMLPAQASAADPAWPRLDRAQVSFILADGVSAGLGAGLSEYLRLAVNLDIGRGSGSVGTSLLLVYPRQFTILTGLYGGVGLTYEFTPGTTGLHLVGGGEFGLWFAEFEWLIPPRNYGKLRSGLRLAF